jgi:hypothetical protein
VPAALACRSVAVRLFAEHFEVLDSHHRLVFSRTYAPEADKGKLIIDPTHYAQLKSRRSARGGKQLQQAFLTRFPSLTAFVGGIQLRMKSLAPVHLRALLRLADSYGEEAFLEAAARAQDYRRFDAHAVERILERHVPSLDDDSVALLGGAGSIALGGVEGGSLDDYSSLDVQTGSAEAGTAVPPEDRHGS